MIFPFSHETRPHTVPMLWYSAWIIVHALERHAAAVRQLSNGTNGDELYIRIATVGNTIQTVNSLTRIWVLLVNQLSYQPHTATYREHKVVRLWLESNLQCISQHTTESAHYPTMPARHKYIVVRAQNQICLFSK